MPAHPPSPPPLQPLSRRSRRALLQGALGLALAAVVPRPRAWDAERLLAAAARAGPRALQSARLLVPLLHDAARQDERARLEPLNTFFNRRLLFRDDLETWGEVEHWASPMELLAKGQGDCEDFAIIKYFSLLATGVAPARLRLVYVQARIGGPLGQQIPHMVLAWYAAPAAEPLVLDNLITEVRPASRRPDLQPVFSFDADGLWDAAGQPAGQAAARLSRWREVLQKAREEGFA